VRNVKNVRWLLAEQQHAADSLLDFQRFTSASGRAKGNSAQAGREGPWIANTQRAEFSQRYVP